MEVFQRSRRVFWSYSPESARESSDSVVRNFLFHVFPAYVTKQSLSLATTFWLGTVTWVLFVILTITGVILMFLYVPSVERAYQSMKDIEFVVSYGSILRSMHRMAAHGMVAVAFLHMVRIWYTKAYSGPRRQGSRREINWLIGLVLFVLTLALSYTGYLLPWDQLAYWALVIGANVAKSAPLVGDQMREILIGGTEIGQNTLIRFYILHCVALPILLVVVGAYHMWRLRRDGGLAATDRLTMLQSAGGDELKPSSTKTYTLLGIKEGTTLSVRSSALPDSLLARANPELTTRLLIVMLLTHVVTLGVSLYVAAPLEAPANPLAPPNPAKAPWYFLWLQELIADTTLTVGTYVINGGFVGGILIPTIALAVLAVWPFLDRSPDDAMGVWFHRSRWLQNVVFTIGVIAVIGLIIVAAYLRGPFWELYWFGEPWPQVPKLY
ncbi:MAG: cytochrome b N-terminal domain-containing protein [Desulfomonilaceae bacterium]|nr:cytochrome b N-terminal domain-containing protein [Desulfomonilaceae bacterium]